MPRKLKVTPQDQETQPKTAAIYCRVSTAEQGQSGLSLKDQEERCRGLCVAKGWEVHKVYIDIASAGSLDRAEFTRLVMDAESSKFNVVVALRLDRISRVPRDFYNVVHDFTSQSIEFTTVDNDIDTTTPQGRMLLGVLLQFAAFEREMGAERTRAAMRKRAAKGLPPATIPPLGYNKIDGLLQIVPEEAKIVKSIFEQYTSSTPPSTIARQLNYSGKRTKFHTSKNNRQTGGKKFTRNHIHRIITNPLYTGTIYFGGENFPGIHDPIISKEVFDLAQQIVKQNAEHKNLGSSKRNILLLNGIIKCGFCGRYMTTRAGTSRSGKKYYYYQCTTAAHEGAGACESRQIKKEDIEYLAIELVKQLGHKKEYLEAIIDNLKRSLSDNTNILNNELQIVRKKRLGVINQQKSLVKMANTFDDIGEFDGFRGEMKDLQELITDLSNQESKLISQLEVGSADSIDSDSIFAVYKEFNAVWDALEHEDKKILLRLLIHEIEVRLKKEAKTGKITFELLPEIPPDLLTKIQGGSSTCSVVLRK